MPNLLKSGGQANMEDQLSCRVAYTRGLAVVLTSVLVLVVAVVA